MKIAAVELRRVQMPLVAPFRTSFGTQTSRDILLVRVLTPEGEGWGECVALPEPSYSSEYIDGAQDVLRRFLIPPLLAREHVAAQDVARVLEPVRGHRMAKAALEMAVLDAELRTRGEPLATCLGAVRDEVEAGVSVGIADSVGQLLDVVGGFLGEGYVRIKLKIEPGWDLVPVAAVRERFGDDLLLQVDANTAYTLADARHLAKLDAFGLLLIEQPLPEEQLRAHAELARHVRTPICLDESITSAIGAVDAIVMGACSVVNIKAGRVGGYLEARRVAEVCGAHGVPVWCGGMVEAGLGRAANLALAARPEFLLPGDNSASGRFYAQDITEPLTLRDGMMPVPMAPGLGVTPIPEVLAELTTSVEQVGGRVHE